METVEALNERVKNLEAYLAPAIGPDPKEAPCECEECVGEVFGIDIDASGAHIASLTVDGITVALETLTAVAANAEENLTYRLNASDQLLGFSLGLLASAS